MWIATFLKKLVKIMGDFGIKIAQPGYDVGTAIDSHLVMTSKLNSFKIQTSLQGIGTVSLPFNHDGTITVFHNLGYFPAYDAWYSDENGSWHPIMENNEIDPSGTAHNIYAPVGSVQNAGTQSINIVLHNRALSGTAVGTAYFMIFLDSIT